MDSRVLIILSAASMIFIILIMLRLRLRLLRVNGGSGSALHDQPEQTQGALLQEEADSLQHYFRKLMADAQDEGFPEVKLVQNAENAWLDLKQCFGDQLPEPQAALALDGSLMFTWRRRGHYLEIEVFPDGHKEAFYENEMTGMPWEAEIPPSASVLELVLEKLSIFMFDRINAN